MATTNNAASTAAHANKLNFDELIDFLTSYAEPDEIADNLLFLHFEMTDYILNDKNHSGRYESLILAMYCLRSLYNAVKAMNAPGAELQITIRG